MITLSFALATAELSDTVGVSRDPQSLLRSSKRGKEMQFPCLRLASHAERDNALENVVFLWLPFSQIFSLLALCRVSPKGVFSIEGFGKYCFIVLPTPYRAFCRDE